jgi:hypothetical protein
MMLSTVPNSASNNSPKKRGARAESSSPKVKKEPNGVIRVRANKKTKKDVPLNGDSLQQILIKTNGEFAEPMHIVLASPVKHQPSTTSYSPNKKNGNESATGWMTTNISQTTKNAQALALKAVARNQVAKINQQQQQQYHHQAMDIGKELSRSSRCSIDRL